MVTLKQYLRHLDHKRYFYHQHTIGFSLLTDISPDIPVSSPGQPLFSPGISLFSPGIPPFSPGIPPVLPGCSPVVRCFARVFFLVGIFC